MADVICVVCNRVNDARAERCWFCGAMLPAAVPGMQPPDDVKDVGELSGEQKDRNVERVPDWLLRIREKERIARLLREGKPVEDGESSEQAKDSAEADIPDQTGNTAGEPGQQLLESNNVNTEPQSSPEASPEFSQAALSSEDSLEGFTGNLQGVSQPGEGGTEEVIQPSLQGGEDLPAVGVAPAKIEDTSQVRGIGVFPAWHPSDAAAVTGKDGARKPYGLNLQSGAEQGLLDTQGNAGLSTADLPGGLGEDLLVSDRQRENAELFRQLLEAPPPGKAADAGLRAGRAWISRLLVAIFIFLALLIPLLFSGAPGVAPKLYANEVVSAFQVMQQFTPQRPVLVAADFEAASTGEMKWISRYILAPALSRNLPITIMSTNLFGSVIMEEYASDLLKETNPAPGGGIVNLGYLPGGTIGLMSLAEDWKKALPYTTELQVSGDVPMLKSLGRLSDFGGVLVFTDSAETAKAWVEQVAPALGSTPLLMVVSAQAAPMLQPYYDSGQVDGIISGVYGALVFDRLAQNSQSPGSLFASYQLTLLAVAMLILVGGLSYFIFKSMSSDRG